MATKKHWTQTPEGKEKLSKAMKKGWKQRKKRVRTANRKSKKNKNAVQLRKSNGALSESNNNIISNVEKEETIKKATTIAFTHCEAWLSVFADSYGISRANLAERVGNSLLSYAERQKVGS